MESSEKLELIDQAVKKLLAENRNSKEDDNDHALLNRLLSELEVLKEGSSSSTIKESEDEVNSPSAVLGNEKDGDGENVRTGEIDAKEIVKELKQVKKQNFVTHCLVSALIVVTLAWQLSEVSLILKIKEGISHPFKSVGSVLGGMIKLPATNGKDADKEEDADASPLQVPPPHVPDLGLNGHSK